MPRLIAWFIAALSLGCLDRPLGFVCQTSAQCQLGGQLGVCEVTRFCSFADASCKSGRRYGHYAGDQRSDQCTECGNGKLDASEECDDGNSASNDACLPNCRWNICGDGNKRDPVEQCDDGNHMNGDGCSENCLLCAGGQARLFWPENGHCYTRFDAPRTWDDAQQACSEAGAYLVTYNSSLEQATVRPAMLTDAMGASSWIGLRDATGSAMYGWVTNEPVIFPMPGFSAPFPTGMCAANRNASGAWSYLPCSSMNGSICEDSGWAIEPERHHAYRVFFAQPSWRVARDTCVRWGGHLATIGDAAEQEFISARFFGTFWLGGTKTAAGTASPFSWITGEAFTFENFAAGEPDNGVQPSCLALGDDRRWHDRPCDGSLRGPYGFICEVE